MKVLHLVSGDGWAGAERALTLLARGFRQERSVDLEAVVLNEGPLLDALRELGLRVAVLPETERSFVRLVGEIRRRIRDGRFDVVHVHRYKEILIAALARPQRQGRLVVTVHGLRPWRQIGASRSLRIWAVLWVARLAGATFVAVSEELRDRLARVLGSRRVTRIPNPVEPASAERGANGRDDLRERFGWRPDRPLVGFVGRLEEVKGPDLFVEIARRMRVDAGMVVVGSGSLAPSLAASTAGIEDRIGFVGEVSDPQPYLAQLDVLALPSRHEGLPMVLLEAAQHRLPVVAFDVGGVREVLDGGPAARLVPAGNVGAFVEALEAQLGNLSEVRTAASRWAERVRGRFSLESAVSAYLQLYGSSRS